MVFNKSTTPALFQLPSVFLFNLLSITRLIFTLYLPFLTLKPYLSSSYTLTFFTVFSPFHPVELSYLFTPGLISARLLPVLALSSHLALFTISHHLFPARRLNLISPPSPPSLLSRVTCLGNKARLGDGNGGIRR